ncbi:phage antirepressor KilAC domain protein [Geobacillus kaustophilus]|uniref:Phage antirepressor KilAC domain protein n=1 Tax=Geobacillus kaustophilus TaxID=1462 RepID=A0A0D8BT92_GEOKU|nr:phage antirepressor KilAC domain protein [Geobacillus kaustophilus]
MNQLQKVFIYSGSQVRTIIKDDEVWFVAKDVCEILDIADARKAVQRLDEDERSLIPVTDSLGRKQETFIVNEPGLYTLILGSRKSEAKQFKRWITHEVIPTIRKTGGYVANDDLFVETYLKHADEQTKLLFRATLETVRKQNEQIAIMQPKADYFDALVDRRLLTNFRDTAKELKIKPKAFIDWMLEKSIYIETKKES